jgi:hypothetical protein
VAIGAKWQDRQAGLVGNGHNDIRWSIELRSRAAAGRSARAGAGTAGGITAGSAGVPDDGLPFGTGYFPAMRITGIHRPSLVISESMGVGQLGRAPVENEPNAKKVPFNANDVGFQVEFPRARVMRVALATNAGGLGRP